jgi:hypothetical protein
MNEQTTEGCQCTQQRAPHDRRHFPNAKTSQGKQHCTVTIDPTRTNALTSSEVGALCVRTSLHFSLAALQSSLGVPPHKTGILPRERRFLQNDVTERLERQTIPVSLLPEIEKQQRAPIVPCTASEPGWFHPGSIQRILAGRTHANSGPLCKNPIIIKCNNLMASIDRRGG